MNEKAKNLGSFKIKEVVEDDATEQKEKPKSKMGDLWVLGSHRLLCGDSTDAKDVEYLMDGKKAHLLFADPPYNVSYADFNKNTRKNGKDWTDVYCREWKDSMSDAEYYTFCKNFIQNAKDNLVAEAHMYIFYASIYYQTFVKIFDELKIKYDKMPLVWKKQTMNVSWAMYKRIYEPFFFCSSKKRWFGPNNEKNVWEIDCESRNKYIHPTQKPVKLPARAIQNSSVEGEIVLEFFGGSGSTMMACEQTGRVCYSIEYEPFFMDGIVKRYKNFTESSKGIYLVREGKEYSFDEIF